MFKSVEQLHKLTQSQIEATTQSAAVLSRGLQQIATEASDFSKRAMEHNAAHVTNLVGAGSIEGAIRVQTDFAKSSFDTMMAEAAKFGEMMLAVTKNAYRPFETALDQQA